MLLNHVHTLVLMMSLSLMGVHIMGLGHYAHDHEADTYIHKYMCVYERGTHKGIALWQQQDCVMVMCAGCHRPLGAPLWQCVLPGQHRAGGAGAEIRAPVSAEAGEVRLRPRAVLRVCAWHITICT